MKLKANLHFHTAEDPCDIIDYSLKKGIDYAAALGFRVLAVTCHQFVAWREDLADYAFSRGILLIPGIELSVHEAFRGGNPVDAGRHVVILNADKRAERVRTFKDLEIYRTRRPESFVMAAHPFFYRKISLQKLLLKYIHLFDGIEHSWFYSRWINYNKRAVKVASAAKKPLIATSDTHYFDYMNDNYIIAEAERGTIAAFFDALRAGRFENVTKPQKFFPMLIRQMKHELKNRIGFAPREHGAPVADRVLP